MTPQEFVERVLGPGLEFCQQMGGPPPSVDARRMLVAIALQESGLQHRFQLSGGGSQPGPARGWWQFEQGGGVKGVMTHPSCAPVLKRACMWLWVLPEPFAVWRAIEGNDLLATTAARMLLWSDPKPLPKTQQDGWEYYLRNWRPGAPRPLTWPANWEQAAGVA